MHDGADDKIEAGRPEGLAVKGPIPDFTSLMEEYGTFELMSRLALVETSLTAPTQCRARIPFDHEQGALDAAEFTQRLC